MLVLGYIYFCFVLNEVGARIAAVISISIASVN